MQRLLFGFLLLFTFSHVAQADVNSTVRELQQEWAKIKYNVPSKKQQVSQMEQLILKAENAAKASPDSAEIKIWQAIIVSSQAGIKGGLGALGLVKKARSLLLAAEKIDSSALDGSVYTSLGALYYQVPGWPIAFGNKNKAKTYLTKALKINPKGIDANFFYGELLSKQGQYQKAIEVLNTALAAPTRPSRPIADAGRRKEIKDLLKKVKIDQAEEED